MADGNGCEVFTDAAWAMWEPLIEEVRPRGKTPPKDLRRTISAILWRHQNGAEWRGIPAELGPWLVAGGAAVPPLGRAGRPGTPARPRAAARRRARDGIPRRHHRPCAPESGGGEKGGCGSQGRDEREALGRSRGGYGTKEGLRDRRRPRTGDRLRARARTGPRVAAGPGPARLPAGRAGLGGRRPRPGLGRLPRAHPGLGDRKSTRLNSSHANISYAVFCLKKKKIT